MRVGPSCIDTSARRPSGPTPAGRRRNAQAVRRARRRRVQPAPLEHRRRRRPGRRARTARRRAAGRPGASPGRERSEGGVSGTSNSGDVAAWRPHGDAQPAARRAVSPARLAKAASGSAKNITPKREITTSNGRRPAPTCATSAAQPLDRRGARRCRARPRRRRSSAWAMSAPTTTPPARRAAAARRVVGPVPQPTSSTRSPGRSPAAANSTSDTGASWRSIGVGDRRPSASARSPVQSSDRQSAGGRQPSSARSSTSGDDLLGAGDERLDLAAAGVDDLLPRRQLDVGQVELGDALG